MYVATCARVHMRIFSGIQTFSTTKGIHRVQRKHESAIVNPKNEESDGKRLVKRVSQLAKSGQTDIQIWRECTTNLIELIDELDIKDISSVLHSYGYMKYRHKKLLELVASKIGENVKTVSTNNVAKILKAYSILKFRSDFLFRLLVPQISMYLQTMSAANAASIFYSYAHLGYYNKNFYAAFQSCFSRLISNLSPYDLTLVLCGYCKVRKGMDEKFLTILACQFCKLIDSYDNKSFSLSVNALSRINFCNHQHVKKLVESEVYTRTSLKTTFSSQSLALILNALSKHTPRPSSLFNHLSRIVVKRIKECDIHSLCLISASFSKVALADAKMFDKIAEAVGRISLQIYPRAIASILYSYGRVKHLHGALVYYFAKHVELYAEEYTCDEIGMILRSLCLLNVRNEEVLTSVAKRIVEGTPDFVPTLFVDSCAHLRSSRAYDEDVDVSINNIPVKVENDVEEQDMKAFNMLQVMDDHDDRASSIENYLGDAKIHSLLWIVQAFAKFSHTNGTVEKCLSKLSNEFVNKMENMTPTIVANFMHALSQLNFRHEECLKMLINEVKDPRRGFKFSQTELRLLYGSLPMFGFVNESVGIYKVDSLILKELKEGEKFIDVVYRVVRQEMDSDVQSLFMQLLKPPIGSVSEEKTADDYVYLHIPEHIRKYVVKQSGDSDAEEPIKTALSEHMDYNFSIN
ncbi:conserved hypothetical protein [Theileria equi strain WA]|uniref:RNA-editing substrate-binding complex 6 protein domain-containing protein n=1 Tax=Theileria equi strain WA TaxID=1537102 RepID=L1LF71_THEEQ|nr:conserved hypothetical protein [Theileria equi strain WA]EKX73890.1 conserved hypothetical protein [Theileria equi strain WA]|eukprot:XP_004833342.1 conserved hypothetical protein [Theileria equi strain WA]